MTRRQVGLLLGLVLASLWFPVGVGTPVGASTSQGSEGAGLRMVRQTTMVAPEDEFRLDVSVSGAPDGATVTTRLYGRITDRPDFGPALLGVGVGRPILQSQYPVEEAVTEAGGDRVLPLRLNLCSQMCGVEDILLSRDGVYPLDVRLVGEDGEELGRFITFIVRLPDEPWSGTPLSAALLLDIHAPPSPTKGAGPVLDADARTTIDVVTQALLDRPEVPVTVRPTPQTVATVAGTEPDLLDRLALALGDEERQVIAGPYVDVPLATFVDAGMTDELAAQRIRGIDVLQNLVPDPGVRSWVADPTLTVEAAARLQEMGVGQVIVDPVGLAPADSTTGSPPVPLTRPFSIETGGPDDLRAVQVDPGLRAAFERPGDVLPAHLLLAELAVIAYDDPDDQHGVVIRPPGDWVPSATFLGVLLDGLSAAGPLIRPVTVDDLLDGTPPEAPGGGPTDDGAKSLDVELAPVPPTDLGAYPQRLAASRRLLDSYRSFIGEGSRRVDPFDELLLVSGAEHFSTEERLALVDRVDAAVTGAFQQLEVATQQTVTLTSTEGQLPVTIRNPLDHRVEVVVTLSSSERLEFEDGGVQAVTLEAGETRSLQFGVRARASGDTPVQVVVRSPDGQQLVEVTRYNVRSMAVSGVGIMLTVGAAAFLALWWIRHIRLVRRERQAIRDQEAEAAGAPESPPAAPGSGGGSTAAGVPSAVD